MPSASPWQFTSPARGDTAAHGVRESAGPSSGRAVEHSTAERISLDHLQLVRGELTSVEDRVKLVIPVQLTGLVALWISIVDFDRGVARGIAGAALGVLLLSLFMSLYLVRPRSLPALLPRVANETASPEDLPVSEVEASIAATLCRAWVQEAERLRWCLMCAIGLSALALMVVIVAYIVDLFFGSPLPRPGPDEIALLALR
jgi:hypothetical protein